MRGRKGEIMISNKNAHWATMRSALVASEEHVDPHGTVWSVVAQALWVSSLVYRCIGHTGRHRVLTTTIHSKEKLA